MKISKITVLLTILIIFVSNMVVNSASIDINVSETETAFEEYVEELEAMGIIEGYKDSDFQPNLYITRAEFCKIIVNIIGKDITVSQSYFTDIESNHWAFNEINYAAKIGLFKGFEDETFRPDEEVVLKDAITTLITLLGYNYLADNAGGYPSGYVSTALQLGVTKGLNLNYESKIKYAEACRLISNTLDIPLVELVGVSNKDNKYKIDDNVTLLSKYLKMGRGVGIVTANDLISIKGNNLASEDRIIINNIQFNLISPENRNLVGLNVKYIYKIDDDEIKQLVYLKKAENMELIIESSDFESFSNEQFVYKGEDDKERKVRVPTSVDIFYNGEFVEFDENIIKNITYGEFKLISTKMDRNYDVLFIYDYNKHLIVDRIDSKRFIISDRFDFTNQINLDPENKKVLIFDSEGKLCDFSEIKISQVLSVIESNNIIEVYISENTVSGVVDEKNYSEKTISINGNAFYINPYSYDIYNSINSGDAVKCFLDYFGRIIYTESLINKDLSAAYLIKVGGKKAGVEDEFFGKFFIPEIGISNLRFANNLSINGDRKTNRTLEDFNNELDNRSGNGKVEQLVILKMNKDNQIISIETAKKLSDLSSFDDGFCITHEFEKRMALPGNNFSFDIYYDLSTLFVMIPESAENATEKDFKVINPALYLSTLSEYNVAAYNYSKAQEVPSVILIKSVGSTGAEVPRNSLLCTVSSITDIIYEEGENGKRFYYIEKGKESYFDISNSNELAYTFNNISYKCIDLKVGDVFTCFKDDFNNVIGFKLYYKYREGLRIHDEIPTNFGLSDRSILRNVDSISGRFITFSYPGMPDQKYPIPGFDITIVTEKDGKVIVKSGNINDIQVGNQAFLQVLSRKLENLIVFQN